MNKLAVAEGGCVKERAISISWSAWQIFTYIFPQPEVKDSIMADCKIPMETIIVLHGWLDLSFPPRLAILLAHHTVSNAEDGTDERYFRQIGIESHEK
jgi:hypothetical protein